jgi:hypothetical protein
MVEPDIGDTYNFCPMEGAEAVLSTGCRSTARR